MKGKREVIELKDFSGGLVTKSPPKNIDSKYSVDCQNVYSEGAILRKRNGITVLNPTAVSGNGNGLYNWIKGSNSTAQWLISFWGSSLYKMDITGGVWDGEWDAIGGIIEWDSYTKLVLHCDGTDGATTFTDEIGTHTVTANGNAQIDTAVKKFGTASLLCDGTDDYLSIPAHSDFDWAGDFTIDFWVNFANTVGNIGLFEQWVDSSNNVTLYKHESNLLTWEGDVPSIFGFSRTWAPSSATWYHVELSRRGNDHYLFVDGSLLGATYTSAITYSSFTAPIRFGSYHSTGNLNGWMDEIRISNGTARNIATFTAPTAAYAQEALTFSTTTVYFANYNGVLLMSTENRDGIMKMTVTDASFSNVATGGSGSSPLAKFVLNWNNHAWYANVQGNEDQVIHSSVNSYNNFTGSTYGSNILFTENDIGITGGFIFSKSLYFTKAFSIHRFTYTGSVSPLVDIKQAESKIGTRSPRAIKEVNSPDGHIILFLGTNKKLYVFDGYDPKEISDGIDITNSVATVYMQNINESALNACFAEVHLDLNWYELFVCIGTATVPNYSIVYDYLRKSFWPMTNRNFSYSAEADNGTGKRVIYVQGATNGITYLTNSTNSDNGTAINSLWTSSKIGVPIILQKIDEIEVETDSVACTPTFRWRADWESAWVSQTMSSGTNSHNWNPGRVDNMIQFQIQDNSSNPSFRLFTIIGSQRAIGGGK